jgi:hypothetical protein
LVYDWEVVLYYKSPESRWHVESYNHSYPQMRHEKMEKGAEK